MDNGRMLAPAFLAMASWVQNTAVSQAEPSSMALSLLRHQPTQVFTKSPCQLLEKTQVVQHSFHEKGSPEVQNQHVIPLREQNIPLLQCAIQEMEGVERKTQDTPFLSLQRANTGLTSTGSLVVMQQHPPPGS